jgi:glycosyltransferase involved in cell wall biosynthesis
MLAMVRWRFCKEEIKSRITMVSTKVDIPPTADNGLISGLSGRLTIAHMILSIAIGGAEHLVEELSLHAKHTGFNCTVICFDAFVPDDTVYAKNNINVNFIKRRQIVFDITVFMRIVNYLKSINASLIHAHDLSSLSYGVPAGLALRIPVVMTEHSRHYIDERSIRRMEKRLLCLGVTTLVDVSPELASASVQIDRIPCRKVKVIENGVDLERFAAANCQHLRAELTTGPGDILVGMVGRLEEIKGPQVLLEAFARLAPTIPSAKLVFVGEGSLGQSLQARVRESGLEGRVHFLGSRSDIPDVMAALDILVLPSLSEGLPFALLEGMASGRAVLATAVGRIPKIICDEGRQANGVLASPDDSSGLADKLTALLHDEPLRRALGVRAREYVERFYGKGIMLRKYEEVYTEALPNGGRL